MIQDEIMKLQTYKMFEGDDTVYVERDDVLEVLKQEPYEDCVSRAELKKWLDMNFSFGGALRKLELFDRLDKELPSVIPKCVTVTDFADKCRECGREKVLDKIRAEIKEWYWQADKQALAKDPCVVDAMIDLFIRTINKYKAESEDKE